MKINALVYSGIALSTAASALPTDPVSAAPNTTAQPIIIPETGHLNLGEPVPPGVARERQADQYLFDIPLELFISLRDQHYPSYFWWESDGCSQSPDAPFGFPFLPACYRHDFGYDQYKKVCTTTIVPLPSIRPSSYSFGFYHLSSTISAPFYHTTHLHSILTSWLQQNRFTPENKGKLDRNFRSE